MELLFIAGYGRSGSTILEQVLAKDPACLALGEVRHLWQRGYMLNTLCACGSPFQECPFWKQLDQAAFNGLGPEQARGLFEVRRRLLRPLRVLAALALGRLAPSALRRDLLCYRTHVLAVYEAAAAASGVSVLIDSSKDPLHGLVLARLPGVSLHVVHLVRDARGVALSLLRPKVRHEVTWKQQLETVRNPTRTAAVWSYRNLLASCLRFPAASYRVVRYEDFVSDPDRVVRAVRADVGLPEPPASLVEEGRVRLPVTHSVSGNTIRFEGRSVALRLDDEWRSALSRRDRLRVTMLASPLLLRYGYLR